MTQNRKHKIAIYGAGGLTGRELLRIMKYHPDIEPAFISSDKYAGTPVADVFPEFSNYFNLSFSKHTDSLPAEMSAVLLAVPNSSALELVPALMDQGLPVVDLSGSFRLHNQKVFENYYNLKHTAFDRMPQITYGIPEIFREKIKTSKTVSNPGCYPTGPILALHALGEYRHNLQSIVVDAKSGVSGAGGRTENSGFSFSGVYENFRAYKILKHQHQPEMVEYAATDLRGELPCPLTFTPHYLPIQRGILATIVLHWQDQAPADLANRLETRCKGETFLRWRDTPEEIELNKVQHTNYVDISIHSHENISIIITAIDNLLKGAAGQAIQNLNLMLGLSESQGLL